MMPQKTGETPVQEHREQEQGAVAVSSGAAAHHNLRNIGLIIRREYTNRVKARGFIITTVILLVIVFLAAFLPTIVQLLTSHATSQTSIVVVNDTSSVAGMNETSLLSFISSQLNGTNIGSRAPYAISSQPATNLNSLQNQVKNGQLDILLVLDRTTNQDVRLTYDTSVSATNDNNLPTIQTLAQQLTFLDTAHRLGLTSQQTKALTAPPDLVVVRTQPSQTTRPASEIAAGYALAFAGVILIFISVTAYAGIVAAGVAEEKSSRVMELLLNAATPFQLLAGKIVGIGAACLTQMGCLVVVGIAALLLQTPLQAALFGASAGGFTQYLTGVSIPFYLLFLLYVLLAFFLYATLYAGLGAIVRRQEEVQNAVMLPQLLMTGGYLLFFVVVSSPDATLPKVLSYIPFWTPMLMLMRLAAGTVAWWEIVVTIALMLLTILACTCLAARLYRFGVLLYGQRPGLFQLLKLVQIRGKGDNWPSQPEQTLHERAERDSSMIQAPSKARGSARLFFADHLRAGLTILVVLHHLAVIYGANAAFYYLELPKDAASFLVLFVFVLINQGYFMGFFFLISGYFTPGSFDHKGPASFLKDRLLRLGIPLLVFALVLSPIASIGLYYWTSVKTPFISLYPELIGVGPLWFVEMLLIFDIGYVIWRWTRKISTVYAEREVRPPSYLEVGVFILALALASYLLRIVVPLGLTIPIPIFGFPTLSYLPQYLSFFILGVIAFRRNWLETIPTEMGRTGFVVAGVATVVLFPLALASSRVGTNFLGQGSWQSAVYALWDSTFSVGICLGLITLFRRFFNRQGKLGRFLSRHAYTVYIIHAPVIVGLSLAVRGIYLENLLKFALAALFGVPLCFALAFLVRKIPFASRIL